MHRSVRAAVSCLLSLCILLCAVPVSAASAPLVLTVAADTHFQCAEDLGAPDLRYTSHILDKETFGYASTQGQMNYESAAILSAMLDDFVASDSPYLLIAGDLTCGKRQSHLAFADSLRRAEQRSGKQIFVINGNHDCKAQPSENGVTMEEFREIYADFGYSEASARHDGSASYTAELGDGYRLLAIDSCIYGEDEGEINASVFRFIREQTARAKRDGKTLIAIMHHSILPHYTLQPMIAKYRYYAGWFADNGIRLVLTGHIHANDVSSAVSDRGNTLYDVQTGALIASPNTYRTLTIDADGVRMESRFITRIDTALLPDTLTATQKALLADDFPAYARAYFENGVGKWFDRNLGSVDRLARWFKLKEGTRAYEAAERMMLRVGDAVGQDIYGAQNSIEASLSPYGIDVPRRGYQKPYQAAATVMYGFFHGDEATISSPQDVQLLLYCLEGAVLSALRTENSDALVRAVTGKTTALRSSAVLREAAEKIALALLQTLAGGFADDYSAPSDLDATLRFSAAEDPAPLHILQQFLRLVQTFFRRLGFRFA